MLDDELKTQLKAYLERLRHPIQLTAFADDGDPSQRMRALLSDVNAASEMVTLADGPVEGERVPSFAIHRPDEPPRVRFAGLPMGHEFTSLVLALLHVGGHPPREEDDTLALVKGLPGPLRFETFFSQSCQNCPDVVQSLNLMAALNPNVEHVAIDGADFQHEVTEREVMAVPTIFLNGEPFGQGRMELAEILNKLDSGAAQRAAAELSEREPYDVLVLGGGPAGAAAAVYAARKGIRTGLVAERFGGQLLDTNAVENYISVLETDGPKLAGALEAHVDHYDVDVIKLQRATQLTAGADGSLGLAFDSGASLKARTLILAPGARWRDMGVPGEQEYRTRGVTYCPHCDGPLFKGKRVAVIGGGNSGIEAAIDLAGVVDHVTVLEFMDELKADAVLVRKLKSLAHVDVILNARTTEVRGDGKQVVGLTYEDRASGDMKSLDVAGIFVQIGLLPNTEWLKGTLELAKTGEIVVDNRGATSLPGVFAAGDATTVPYKQIIIAAGDGAKAALSAFDHLIRTTAPPA